MIEITFFLLIRSTDTETDITEVDALERVPRTEAG